MKDGFLKVAAAMPDVRVGDVENNLAECVKEARALSDMGAQIVVFPELSVTSASCGDLFFNRTVLCAAECAVAEFVKSTASLPAYLVIGAPVKIGDDVYSAAITVRCGEVLAISPISGLGRKGAALPTLAEFSYAGFNAPVCNGLRLSFEDNHGSLLTAIVPCSGELTCDKETGLIIIPAAEPEGIDVSEKRRGLIYSLANTLNAAVIFANAGVGESGSECVYSGHSVIAFPYGGVSYREPFSKERLVSSVDASAIINAKRKIKDTKEYKEEARASFELTLTPNEKRRHTKTPFVSEDVDERRKDCRRAFEIQAQGLAGRFERSYSKTMVVGISGGLDSTLALLVMARAVDILKEKGKSVDRSAISAITMPCFGTTERTKSNAERLSELLGASVRCIDIKAAVTQHFLDIGHDAENYNVVYENAQARERTQVLMDIANAEGGLVVGTGDLSEAALGWATYNGDHMSMYGVNATVPKTLVRAIVENYADECGSTEISAVLSDILATPVSPELLPPKDGEIAQCTEGIVGPYELHDFFLYHFVKYGPTPEELCNAAVETFAGVYEESVVRGWCEEFLRRFITQQFKRSCTPDAPSVGIVSLSPRGAWKMPSDFSAALFSLKGKK